MLLMVFLRLDVHVAVALVAFQRAQLALFFCLLAIVSHGQSTCAHIAHACPPLAYWSKARACASTRRMPDGRTVGVRTV